MRIPQTWVKKRGIERSISCWISTRGQVTGTSHSDSHPLLWMTDGRSVSTKSNRMTWRYEWMPRLEKFSENALKASSSWNWIWVRVWSEDEEALEWRGFRAGVDLRLGAIDTTNVNRKRERERKTIKKVPSNFKYNKYIEKEYVCMGNAWTCDMHKKLHHGLNPIQTYQHTNR